ncbi:MAG TPA: 3-oxoacyl-[acyl-carrier-protein] synthase III C-terminal domain-containing protein [Nakamurella sp.]
MTTDSGSIGIAGIATELADLRVGGEEFARLAGIPLDVVERRFGFRQTFRWGDGRGPMATGVRCASRALSGVHPEAIDLICTLAHPYHPEREIYGYGAVLQDALGANNAELLEISDTCASVTLALQTIRELMCTEPDLTTVLVVGVLSMFQNLDLSNPRTTWMANLSDGAGALLLVRDPHLDNAVMETAQVVDAQFIDQIVLSSPYLDEPVTYRERFRRFLPAHVDVVDKDALKRGLDEIALPSFVAAIRESVTRSGFTEDQVDFIGANMMKRSLWQGLLESFALAPDDQIFLDDVGHVGYLDQFLFLQRLRDERRLARGGVAVLATPGVGFHWTATTVAFKGPRLRGAVSA